MRSVASLKPSSQDGASSTCWARAEGASVWDVDGNRYVDLTGAFGVALVGHALGASGAIESLACIKAIETGIVPPTINYSTPDPDCDLDCVPGQPRELPDLRVAISNSFGFGGSNATVVLGKA